ncbi:MAG TPA: helix-turn-helix domain-containing protein [Bacilli bacterium]|jgi:predicted nucleotidyltransferase|nr:helix-turn-helix domain-containing protein [Bacilli bacterium]HOF43291.1 helix-turn-helix domain-containing protein [Bacilli bacterium]
MKLKKLRQEKGLTQEQVAQLLGVTRRTYLKYENDQSSLSEIKYKFIYQTLEQYGVIDEERGILTIEQIKNACFEIFKDYDVEYCYLFGSYAKGNANPKSDIDLLISVNASGLQFFEIVERLREKLKKKIDLLDAKELEKNILLVEEILKDGVKIYG